MTKKNRDLSSADFTRKIVEIDESVRELASLDELYTDIISDSPGSQVELDAKKDEAEFARDHMLKLSLHIKHKLEEIESHEVLK